MRPAASHDWNVCQREKRGGLLLGNIGPLHRRAVERRAGEWMEMSDG